MKTAQEWASLYSSKEFKDKFFYPGNDLGAKCTIGLTTIKLWSPVAESVTVNFYKDGEPGTKAYWTSPMVLADHGVWQWQIYENLDGTYYDFTIEIDGERWRTSDPYAVAAGVNGQRSLIIDLPRTNPDGWHEDKAPVLTNEQIIDEVHVKEFSWDPAGGWPSDVRGKYKAFTISDTSLNNEAKITTGLTYLKNLGITHIQLMPIFDFGSVDETNSDNQFNWGYDPVNYNVPEGSYASDPHRGEIRICELKEAIQALHRKGFRVIMDVVYNHTWNLDNPLQKTVPYYFYRTWPDGSLSNGSGCGNDIACERPMVEKYIIDSVLYWTKEYHLDGFRFDLMGLLTVDLMNKIRQKLDSKYGINEKLVYGEPWSADKTALDANQPLASKNNMSLLDDNIAVFSDDTRDTIKGSAGNIKEPGFVNGAIGKEQGIIDSVKAWCIDGSPVKAPSQIINYVSAHDNQTLWDKLAETTPNEDLRIRQYRLAVAIYMTCQGRLFMLSGSSFLRTKNGHTNSHDAPIEINQLDWQKIAGNQQLSDYYRGLIALRQQLPGLYDKSPLAKTRIGNTWAQNGIVGFMVDNTDDEHQTTWDYLCLVYNRNNAEHVVQLDDGEWDILATGDDTWLWQNPTSISSQITVNPVGWVMLGQKHQYEGTNPRSN